MGKAGKIALIRASIGIAGLLAAWLFVGALWSGAFNFLFPHEIAAYSSPNGEYTPVFQQTGDLAWPFGPAVCAAYPHKPPGQKAGAGR